MSNNKFLRQIVPVLAVMSFGIANAQTTAPASTMAPMKAPATTTAPAGTMAPMKAPMTKTAKTAALPATEQFTTVAVAEAHCPGDTIVWSTLSKSKSFHAASSKYYGKTKKGAYVCEKTAEAAGFHAAKN